MSFTNLRSKFVHSVKAHAVECTELSLINTVSEISTDGTMAGDSDSAIPTEKAVKAYVDDQAAGGEETGNQVSAVAGNSVTTVYLTYVYTNNRVTLEVDALVGTGAGTAITFAVPTVINPGSDLYFIIPVIDNNVRSAGVLEIANATGTVTVYADTAGGNFSSNPNTGWYTFCISYTKV